MMTDIKLMAVFPVQKVVAELADLFRQETGNSVTPAFTTSGAIRQKLAAGESADAVILNDYEIDELMGQGVIVSGSRTDIARFGLGVVIRPGARLPDISTPEALKQTLLSAMSVAYGHPERTRGGAHFAAVLQRLGIAEAMKEKTLLSNGGAAVTDAVAKGAAQIGVTGMSKSIIGEGVTLVGPLPNGLQKIMTLSAGLLAQSKAPEEARAFAAFLVRPSFKSRFAEEGLDYRG